MLAAKPACPPAKAGKWASGLASGTVKPSDSEAERCIHHQPSPPQRAVHYFLHCRQLNLKRRKKERFSQLVKNKPRVSRKYGCRLFLAYFCKFLILLTLQFLFCFRKQKIKRGKERKRNSFWGQRPADGGGDFDVFASCLRQAAASAPQLLLKSSRKGKPPPTRNRLCLFPPYKILLDRNCLNV